MTNPGNPQSSLSTALTRYNQMQEAAVQAGRDLRADDTASEGNRPTTTEEESDGTVPPQR